MTIIEGIVIFDGIADAQAFVIPDYEQNAIPKFPVTQQGAREGWERFDAACQKIKELLDSQIEGATDFQEKRIFETHRMMLEDTVFFEQLRDYADETHLNIESALDSLASSEAEKLRSSGNAALAERADDILDVFGRVLRAMLHGETFNMSAIPQGAVVAAKKLNPSDALLLFKRHPAGLCLAEGGASGHLAILARGARIPSVFAAANAHTIIQNGERVIIDGGAGRVFVNPDAKTALAFETAVKKRARQKNARAPDKTKPCITKDGKKITLLANIGSPEEAREALLDGAEGIGLFRTEFLFMKSALEFISEDAQFEAYKTALEIMRDKPVVIRTLDAGGDKFISASHEKADVSRNPLLGRRSIRLSLARPEIFKQQLRALLRASVYGNLRIMLPLVVSLEEVKAARFLFEQAKKELIAKKIPFKKDIPFGIMIETAAASLCSDVLAKHCDFFSIGTNDLTQYSLAIDRENPLVSPLYNEFHLTILRLIKATVDGAKKAKIPVSVCGEMAGNPQGAAMLTALGIDTLSMTSSSIHIIKSALAKCSKKELALKAKNILLSPLSTDVQKNFLIRPARKTRNA
jgi:phosphotransferase system enzyme I (PtsI)